MVDNILILAGGSGTRLWPASLKNFPKQFIKIRDGNSLLALTIRRAISLNIPGKIIIITLKSQMGQVIRECIPFASTGKIAVIPEPEPKNTAPAIAAAVKYFQLAENDPSLLVLPSDHIIEDLDGFRHSVEKADIMARKGFLVTFGIRPEYPETGYGYIQKGTEEAPGFTVKAFTEKPDLAKAREFISSGNYLWNSGMFCFKASSYWNELTEYTPEITRYIGQIQKTGTYTESGVSVLMDTSSTAEAYKASPSISIDYAVMEKSSRAGVIDAEFDWNDIGSWDKFQELGNTENTDVFPADSNNNYVFSDIPVVLCGVDDLIVVIKNGKALICRKGMSQKVKDARKLIEDAGKKELL